MGRRSKYARAVDKSWTARDDELLKQLFFIKKLHIVFVCNNLLRTEREVYNRAKELGFVRSFKRAPSRHMNHKFKLNYEKAEEMRDLAKSLSIKELAYKYDVSVPTVHRVIKNQIWKKEDAKESRNVGSRRRRVV